MRGRICALLLLVGAAATPGCGTWQWSVDDSGVRVSPSETAATTPAQDASAGEEANPLVRWRTWHEQAVRDELARHDQSKPGEATDQTPDAHAAIGDQPLDKPEPGTGLSQPPAQQSPGPTQAGEPPRFLARGSAANPAAAAEYQSSVPPDQPAATPGAPADDQLLELYRRQLLAMTQMLEQQQSSAVMQGTLYPQADQVLEPLRVTNEHVQRAPQNILRSASPAHTGDESVAPPFRFDSLPGMDEAFAAQAVAAVTDPVGSRAVQRVRGLAVVDSDEAAQAGPIAVRQHHQPATANYSAYEMPADFWQEHVQRAIVALKQEQASEIDQSQRVRNEAYLRLLYLTAEQQDQAIAPIDLLDASQQEFWREQLWGLHRLLDDDGMPGDARRFALALRHLRDAEGHLAAASTLDLRNLSFCKRVDSFGHFVEFDEYRFTPDQEVLLYVEVDNFQSELKQDGQQPLYETQLEGNYQILDLNGRRMADYDLPPDIETCRNRRRDYFLVYRIYMPKNLGPGQYRLQLTIRDQKAEKSRQTHVDFQIY